MNLQLVNRVRATLISGVGQITASGLFLVLIFSLSTSTLGVDPDRHISQYRHTAWRIKDGLFRGEPNVITQTPDGYIWIGTSAGLIRFDGVRMVPWKPPDGSQLPSPNITALLASRDGSLWIGTDAGLSHWMLGGLANYLTEPGRINTILEDQQGKIWVMRSRLPSAQGPLCQVSDSTPTCYHVPDENSIGNCCGTLVEDSSGNLWMGTNTGLLQWHDGSLTVHPNKTLKPNTGTDGVEALAFAHDGSLLVGIDHGGPGLGLERLEQDAWKPFREQGLDGSKLAISSLLLDRDRALWIGTFDQGIYRICRKRADHLSMADGLSSNSVNRFYQDREGNIWVVTSKGIDSFRDLPVVCFSAEEGLKTDNVASVLGAHDGTVWVGSAGSLDAIRDGMVSSIRAGKGLPGYQVTSLLEDRAGRLWVGVDDKLWIYQNGQFTEIRRTDGGHVGTVAGMTEDEIGDIWVVTIAPSRKLVRIRDFKVVEEMQAPHVPDARAVAADQHAGIWLGLMNGDLARYRNGNVETFSFKHDPNQRVRQVIVDSDNSVLGATAAGLIGWKDGRLQTMAVNNGLPCDDIFSVLSDQKNYWLYTQCGLVQIAVAQMQQWWEQPSQVLQVNVIDQSDGVRPQYAVFSPPASQSPDGKLWFATNSVLQMFDPGRTRNNSVVPPVHIEQVIADGKTYLPTGDLALPGLVRSLEIDYTGLSFVAPEKVRFRYKLEGHSVDWQDCGGRRQAFFNDLAPGKYKFRVIAANNDGLWNDEGSSLTFSIAPAWYQTVWFKLICLVAVGLAGSAIYQLRVRQIERQFNVGLEARVDERMRIARELHDTLLQSFHGLLLRFQSASDLLPTRPEDAKQRLENAIDYAAKAITEGRDAVQQLRSTTVARNDLASEISMLASELSVDKCNGNHPEFSMRVEGPPRNLHPIVRDEVYRIAAEALRNAFKHSEARRIEVEIRYGERELRLRTRDDGKGIDPAIPAQDRPAGHWGLSGMRERAKLLGGKLQVWSEVDSGTEVELIIPASVAYAERGAWYRRLLSFRRGA
jgi:signal transduction histidine kinase/ligand-binding sensor domain-containing protein